MEETTKRITKEQKYMLVQYLEEHREFANDRFVNSTGIKSLGEQWDALAERLNSLGGALKNGENWKRAWANMRSKAKQKYQDFKNSMEKSGIIGAQRFKLTDLDERVIGIMTKESVVGQEDVGEPLRVAGLVPDVSIVEKANDYETSNTGASTSHITNSRCKRKRQENDLSAEMRELERQFLEVKRRKNDIAQAQVNALYELNATLSHILKRLLPRQD